MRHDRALGDVTVRVASNFWIKWAEIALEHAGAAKDARRRADEASAGSRERSEAFGDELGAGLVAVTSAAFAIDAWYKAIERMVALPPHLIAAWSKCGAPSRSAKVMETLRAGFNLGSAGSRWGRAIKDLYRLRDHAVHFESVFHEAQPHPTGKSNVSRENVIYSADAAANAADLAVDVVTVCMASPRPMNPDLRKWCGERAHVPSYLAEKRRAELGDVPLRQVTSFVRP
jgi:hypothetical protein